MFTSYIFLFPTLVALSVYLSVSVAKRRRKARTERVGEWEKDWNGTGLDVGAISPVIRRVRADYAAVAHPYPRPAYYRRGLLTSAAQVIRWLPYFRHIRPSDSEHEPERYAQN